MGVAERWLVWRLRQGDRDACREMIRLHHGAVYGYLRRLGADGALAEDLTQETYARAWSAIAGLRKALSLRSWLLAIARNQFFQRVRAKGLDEVPEAAPPDRTDPGPDALDALEGRERDARLHHAVDGLDAALRETVSLHYFHELSLREVGVVLGIPAGTVKSRLNRALDTLRHALDGEEASHDRSRSHEAPADPC